MNHPLYQFEYCPKCGAKHFEVNNEKSKRCRACGFVYYFNSSAAVVALIQNREGEVLVATRAKEPAKGTWDLPGGFVDMHETAEEAVCREVIEETDLNVNRVNYLFSLPNLYVYSDFEVHTVDMFFLCVVDDLSPLMAHDDVAQLEWVSVRELNPDRFGLQSIRQGIEKLLDENKLLK